MNKPFGIATIASSFVRDCAPVLRVTKTGAAIRAALLYFLCGALFTTAGWAEKGYVVIHVSDIHERPIAGVELATDGASESGITDRFGRARIKLSPQVKANDWLALQIVRSPAGKDLVFISPWDAHAQVPPYDNETVNFLPLVLADRGDKALLENGNALTAIAAQINKANSAKPKTPDPEQERRQALATIAKAFGLAPEEVDKAIRAWGERTSDPYEKGLAALYENNYPLASKELSESLEMREQELAKAQGAAADAAFFLGKSRYGEGKYHESVSAYRRALDLRHDDPTVMNNLGLSMKETGDYAGAEALYRQALATYERKLGPHHPLVAKALGNLAALLQDKGDYVAAEQLSRRALAIDENALGPSDAAVAQALINLAGLLQHKGDYAGAEVLCRQALAIDENALGLNDPLVGRDLNNLAESLVMQGDYSGAEPLLRRALGIAKRALGPDHPSVAINLNNLAGLLWKKRDYAGAEALLRQALAIDEKTFGSNHPNVGRDLNNLAILLRERRDYSEAEPLFRRALEIAERALGPNHPTVGTALNNLAGVLRAEGDYAGAELLFRRALAIHEKALGPVHPDVARELNNLAALLKAKGDYAGAEPLYRRALAIDEKTLGLNHPATRAIRKNLEVLEQEKSNTGQDK